LLTRRGEQANMLAAIDLAAARFRAAARAPRGAAPNAF
jgi:hypothetical protein